MFIDESYEAYKSTKNVISKLCSWKEEVETKLSNSPEDTLLHAQISELELAIARLKIMAKTEIFSEKATVQQLEDTPDDYDYRLMCEWGYRDRANWTDAKVGSEIVVVKAGSYIINN
ncbi:hypothetical protein [Photobacterium alginatilyticum]|uniref:Uncharacterized protein n=1 Tax=Photobacterium alginatilyticum TaxID=1775171 RepID=A0ABW9YV90_9GAMM|nr:hypothetical protein [Photobacterium alginatilyticum]NBI56299.1 hypothetical protein [Photobacterium alginatilyticum]